MALLKVIINSPKMHQISPTTISVSKNFPGGETPGPPLLRGPLRGGDRERVGREGEGEGKGEGM